MSVVDWISPCRPASLMFMRCASADPNLNPSTATRFPYRRSHDLAQLGKKTPLSISKRLPVRIAAPMLLSTPVKPPPRLAKGFGVSPMATGSLPTAKTMGMTILGRFKKRAKVVIGVVLVNISLTFSRSRVAQRPRGTRLPDRP